MPLRWAALTTNCCAINIPRANCERLLISDLIRRAQEGDSAAFAELYVTHRPKVYANCVRLLKKTQDAEDATQDVFVMVYERLGQFRGEASFSTWLFRVTVATVFMGMRKWRRERTRTDGLDEDAPEQAPRFVAHDRALESTLDRLTLQHALDSLPEGQRAVLELKYIDGLEHREIAALRRHSVGNSKSQLFKACLKVRYELSRKRPLLP